MATTTNYSWNLPTVGGSTDTWGDLLNANWTAIDTLLGGTNATEFAILDGATVTTAELNILDGVTATTAEINVLDGITATVTELNYTSGVTSSIQTQLNGKQSLDATLTAYAGTLTAANKIPYATATDTAGELDFKDEDDMASDSATAVPSQQSVKAYVDAEVAGATDTFSAASRFFDSASGLQLRFGTFSSTIDTSQSVSFSTAFDTACICVVTSFGATIESRSQTGFTINRLDVHGDGTCDYIAVGY